MLAREARWLALFWERGLGWIGRAQQLDLALGIPLAPKERVHTLGVAFSLDLAYCDERGRVVHLETLSPARIGPAIAEATVVWELVAGALAGVTVGETLLWHD